MRYTPKKVKVELGKAKQGKYEFERLAQYNAEKARGLVHTAEWNDLMKQEQARFDHGLSSILGDHV